VEATFLYLDTAQLIGGDQVDEFLHLLESQHALLPPSIRCGSA